MTAGFILAGWARGCGHWPEFDSRTYGCAKLITLIEKAGCFEVRRDSGQVVMVRHKHGKRTAAAAA
jgi:hypothetical protein